MEIVGDMVMKLHLPYSDNDVTIQFKETNPILEGKKKNKIVVQDVKRKSKKL